MTKTADHPELEILSEAANVFRRIRIRKSADLLAPLDEVDRNAEMWGQYLGGIARAVVEQYAGQLYSTRDDGDVIADIRKGFLKAFGG